MEDKDKFLKALYLKYLNEGNHKFFNIIDLAKECDISDESKINEIIVKLEVSNFIQIIRTPIQTAKITEIGISQINKNSSFSQSENTLTTTPSKNKLKILFFASNPESSNHLELDKEVREINQRIKLSKYNDLLDLKSCWAVRPRDLLQEINELNPDIVHFSGHGDVGSIFLQDDSGSFKEVSCYSLVTMFESLSSPVRLIVFNNCHSNSCASEVVSCVDSAIGMLDEISDEAAIHFAAQLYSSIGFGLSIDKAYKQAKAQILLEGLINEENTPQLHGKDGVDLSKMKLIELTK